MKSIIFALLIGCGKKTDTTSTSTETEQSVPASKDDVQTISLAPNSTTLGGTPSVSPSNSIEIKAIVRPDNTETEKKEEDILPLPEDADDIDDTVDSE